MNMPYDLPLDRALPHLMHALDPEAMHEVFDDTVRRYGAHLESCRIERIKYRPSRNCTLSYHLHMRRECSGEPIEQRVTARLFGGDEIGRRAARVTDAGLSPSPAGPAVRLLPALDMLTWWWPNDSKLTAPRVLADESALRERVLPPVVAALSDGRGRLTAFDVDVAQYVPENRLCARVTLHWTQGRQCRSQVVYAKASREPDSATAHGYLREVCAGAAWRGGALRTPRALLWQPDFGLHWQSALPGRDLLDFAPTEIARLSPRLGAQLAALHHTRVSTSRELTREALHERLTQVVRDVGYVLPAARDTLRRAQALLLAGLKELPCVPHATLHGDLHARNILVADGLPGLIDLDGLRAGPAVLELGAWIADGMYHALLHGEPPSRDRDAWNALLAGYQAAGGRVASARDLAWAVAWNLLCQRAWRCVTNLKPGRFVIAPRLIELACAIADARNLEGI